MYGFSRDVGLTGRVVDALYVEAMVLADEARSYFDDVGRSERESLTPLERVGFSCESLKVTTRLMHIIAWLLTRRAVEKGEISAIQGREPARRLGHAAESVDATVVYPETLRALIAASSDLYGRVWRLDQEIDSEVVTPSPARRLMRRLERAF